MSIVTEVISQVAAEKVAAEKQRRATEEAKSRAQNEFIESAKAHLKPVYEAVLQKAKDDLVTLGYSAESTLTDHTTHLTASFGFCPVVGDSPTNLQGMACSAFAATNAATFLIRVDHADRVQITCQYRKEGVSLPDMLQLTLSQLHEATIATHFKAFLLATLRSAD